MTTVAFIITTVLVVRLEGPTSWVLGFVEGVLMVRLFILLHDHAHGALLRKKNAGPPYFSNALDHSC